MGYYRISIIHPSDRNNDSPWTTVESNKFSAEGIILRVNAPRTHISGRDPIIEGIVKTLKSRMRLKHLVNGSTKKSIVMYVGKCKYMVILRKVGNKYNLNGLTANMDIIEKAIARTILRACYLDESEESYDFLDEYLEKCIFLPENINYVLENKLPFSFYEGTIASHEKHECRMNIKQISPVNFAIEISSGVWGELTMKEVNTFVNTFWKKQRKGKWYAISPGELYDKLLGDKPTSAQVKVMVEFLKQNRTQDIVEKRAMELFEDLVNNHDNIKKGMYNFEAQTRVTTTPHRKEVLAMYIRGRYGDWMIIDNTSKTGIQDVSTYILKLGESSRYGGTKVHLPIVGNKECVWSGPICIDNLQSGASKGDQFASRAFACMNDVHTAEMVSTIKGYLTGLSVDQKKVRLDWDALP